MTTHLVLGKSDGIAGILRLSPTVVSAFKTYPAVLHASGPCMNAVSPAKSEATVVNAIELYLMSSPTFEYSHDLKSFVL